ncbi:MAG: hypothetical protein ACLQVL_22190 [Terriglobia bacterium]
MLKTKTLHPETAENPPENVEVRLAEGSKQNVEGSWQEASGGVLL